MTCCTTTSGNTSSGPPATDGAPTAPDAPLPLALPEATRSPSDPNSERIRDDTTPTSPEATDTHRHTRGSRVHRPPRTDRSTHLRCTPDNDHGEAAIITWHQGDQIPPETLHRLTRVVYHAEAAALRSAPLTRTTFWLAICLIIETTALTAILTMSWKPALALLPATIPLGIWLSIWATTRFRAAQEYAKCRDVLVLDDHSGGTAVLRLRPHTDCPHTDTVVGVAAWPLNTGLGTTLLDTLAHWADTNNTTLTLGASSRRVASFYQRHGFTLDGTGRRHPTCGYRMTRTPQRRYPHITDTTQSVSAGQPTRTPQTPTTGPRP